MCTKLIFILVNCTYILYLYINKINKNTYILYNKYNNYLYTRFIYCICVLYTVSTVYIYKIYIYNINKNKKQCLNVLQIQDIFLNVCVCIKYKNIIFY